MTKIESHRDLIVWQRGMDLVEGVYAATKNFPVDERFRLINQATRAAVSVPANIAEGHARGTRREYAQFVAIAKGSLMEARDLCHDRAAPWLRYGPRHEITTCSHRGIEPYADGITASPARTSKVEPEPRTTL